MAVSFERIPSNIRVPLFYVEITNQLAGYFAMEQPAALIGPSLTGSFAALNEPVRVNSYAEAVELFGEGSILADMVNTYRFNDSFGEIWCVPVAATGAVAAEGLLEFQGTATQAGLISLNIGGDLVRVTVARGADGAAIATATVEAINGMLGGLVSADSTTVGEVELTARQPGALGDDILIQEVELPPPGITITIVPMANGAGVADVGAAMTALGDETYDFIGLAYSDAAALDAVEAALNDVAGRWAWDRQSYGHAFTARMGTANDLATFGRTRNDPHVTIAGYPPSATPPWRVTAAWLAQAAVSLRVDPARPLQTLPLVGVLPPHRAQVFTRQQMQVLLNSGIAPANPIVTGEMQIIRSITSYQRNRWNQPDPSWLDIQTPFTLMYFVRFMRGRILQKFPRHKLASDGAVFGPGQAIVTPRIVRAELLAAYDELQRGGLVEDIDSFDRLLIVERNANDPNRIDVLASPDLVNQLRILAMLVAFRLQTTALPPGTLAAPFMSPMVYARAPAGPLPARSPQQPTA